MVDHFRSKTDLTEFCEVIHPDDGLSSQDVKKKYQIKNKKADYHQQQLARQIQEALDLAIMCDCKDPVFEGVSVNNVDYLEESGKFQVTFISPCSVMLLDELLMKLEECRGILTEAVARNINRKRLPCLSFTIKSCGEDV